MRRRLTPVRRALLAVVTLLPELFAGDAQLAAVRLALATPSALMALRTSASAHLAVLPTPLGQRRLCAIRRRDSCCAGR